MPDVFGTAFFTIGNYNPPTGEAVLPMLELANNGHARLQTPTHVGPQPFWIPCGTHLGGTLGGPFMRELNLKGSHLT